MNHEKWWKRSFIGSLIFHLILLSWIAWVNPFAPKPNPQEDYLDLELVDIKDLPPIPKSSTAPAGAVEAKAIPALKPKEATTPKTIMPTQKIVSPEEATESAPVVTPGAAGSSASNGSAAGGSHGGQGVGISGNDGASGRDLSCGPVVVSRGTAVCASPSAKTVKSITPSYPPPPETKARTKPPSKPRTNIPSVPHKTNTVIRSPRAEPSPSPYNRTDKK